MSSAYLARVARLLRHVPTTLDVAFEAPFDEAHEFAPRGPAETDVFADALVKVELRLESFSGGLWARGRVIAPWHGACRRCSTSVLGLIDVRVSERFVAERGPGDEDAYLTEGDFVDLAPLVHDTILLELPLAPLCREDCRGFCPQCGIDRNEASCDCQAPIDSRWATLDGLRFTGAEPDESNEA